MPFSHAGHVKGALVPCFACIILVARGDRLNPDSWKARTCGCGLLHRHNLKTDHQWNSPDPMQSRGPCRFGSLEIDASSEGD
jgi:hypothetical protein